MLKRLRGILFGKPRSMVAAQDLSFYPMVGTNAPAVDATMFWSGEAPAEAGLDRTVLAPMPDAVTAPLRPEPPSERPRLAWPARDASRVPGEAPPAAVELPAAAKPRFAPPSRPNDDLTVLVARRPRPHQPSA